MATLLLRSNVRLGNITRESFQLPQCSVAPKFADVSIDDQVQKNNILSLCGRNHAAEIYPVGDVDGESFTKHISSGQSFRDKSLKRDIHIT